MAEINPEFIERYQILYEKDPQSRVFAPLAEAYRQMGLKAQALEICTQGVKTHPNFASGHIVLARLRMDDGKYEDALMPLKTATQLSPDNILAHRLLGQCFLKLKRPKEALTAYKMVLFLNPQSIEALEVVRKWEFLTAQEYADELFDLSAQGGSEVSHRHSVSLPRSLDRALSLADAYLIRNEIQKAREVLEEIPGGGEWPEVRKRLQLLKEREDPGSELGRSRRQPSSEVNPRRQIEFYRRLLRRITSQPLVDAPKDTVEIVRK